MNEDDSDQDKESPLCHSMEIKYKDLQYTLTKLMPI